jgi:hypothetical protein
MQEFYTGGDLYKRYLKQAKEGPLNEQWICSKVGTLVTACQLAACFN